MKKQRILLALLGLLVGWGGAGMAHAAGPAVTFQAADNPGSWFECANTGSTASGIGCVPASLAGTGQKSIAVIRPNEQIAFTSMGQASTIHTAVSLMFPTGAANMPFDTDLKVPLPGTSGSPFAVTLVNPGLYVFFCDIHPYMFATVIVDDPTTAGLDLGKTVSLPHVTANGIGVPGGLLPQGLPTASDLVLRLVHAFFVITDPNNWQQYPISGSASWNPSYPPVPVLASSDGINNVFVPDLNAFLRGYFHEPKTLLAPIPPTYPGVGQVWVDTQFEKVSEKTKPGTATAVNAHTFKVERKVALPHINMNNPHNMWTDRNQKLIYQTEWFDNYLTVFDRVTGQKKQRIHVGDAPAHVMTRTNNDYVHVSLNGANDIVELAPHATSIIRNIPMGVIDPNNPHNTHPHAHTMSANGNLMVTPNEDGEDSTLYDFPSDSIAARTPTGHTPIATGMMPDSSKYYVANFLDSTISVIKLNTAVHPPTAALSATINLLANYDPITLGGVPTGPVGGLPIQTPVSPDGRYMITANTLTATILVIDTHTDTMVAMLPCDPGCHGVQFGAKKGGGYYAYVSSKFSNRMLVVDPDPNGAGVAPDNGSNAIIAGSVLLTEANQSSEFESDGTVHERKYAGMGGQGVLPIPLVYNGWVQNLPEEWKEKLTRQQRHPIGHQDRDHDGHEDHK